MKILLDINVIVDVLSLRQPFYADSAQVLTLCEIGRIKGYIAAHSFSTLHYILSRELKDKKVLPLLESIRSITSVAKVDEKVIDLAMRSHFSDFEDAVQYYCAIRNKLSIIVTRNKKDYSHADIPVMTPQEFIASINKTVGTSIV